MLEVLRTRWKQGYRTIRFPAGPPPELPPRFVGLPQLDSTKCREGCLACVEVCPTQAVDLPDPHSRLQLDLGRCLFCRECEQACPDGSIRFTREFRLAASRREDLVVHDGSPSPMVELSDAIYRVLGHSLKLRKSARGDATPARRTPTC